MRLSSRTWASGVLWFFPVSVALGLLVIVSDGSTFDASAASVSTLGSFAVVMVAPVVAGAAAWASGRLRRAGWNRRPTARGPAIVAAEQLWPLVLTGWVALLACVAMAMAQYSWWGLPSITLLVPALLTVCAAAISGWALGTVVRDVVAAPTALAVWYFVLAFPPALDPVWFRHLSGVGGCCWISESIDPRVVAGVSIMAVSIIALSIATLLLVAPGRPGRPWLRRAPLVLATVAGASVASSVLLVHDLGVNPTVPRQGALVCERLDGASTEVCVWPERAESLQAAAAMSHAVVEGVGRRTGAPIPAVLTQEVVEDQTGGRRSFWAPRSSTGLDLAALLGASSFPVVSESCAALIEAPGADPVDTTVLYSTAELGRLWWQAQAVAEYSGRSTASLDVPHEIYGPELAPGLAELWSMDGQELVTWLTRASDAVAGCAPGVAPWDDSRFVP